MLMSNGSDKAVVEVVNPLVKLYVLSSVCGAVVLRPHTSVRTPQPDESYWYVSGTGAGSEPGSCLSARTSALAKRYCEKVRGSAPAT